jgi:hypothetical protein
VARRTEAVPHPQQAQARRPLPRRGAVRLGPRGRRADPAGARQSAALAPLGRPDALAAEPARAARSGLHPRRPRLPLPGRDPRAARPLRAGRQPAAEPRAAAPGRCRAQVPHRRHHAERGRPLDGAAGARAAAGRGGQAGAQVGSPGRDCRLQRALDHHQESRPRSLGRQAHGAAAGALHPPGAAGRQAAGAPERAGLHAQGRRRLVRDQSDRLDPRRQPLRLRHLGARTRAAARLPGQRQRNRQARAGAGAPRRRRPRGGQSAAPGLHARWPQSGAGAGRGRLAPTLRHRRAEPPVAPAGFRRLRGAHRAGLHARQPRALRAGQPRRPGSHESVAHRTLQRRHAAPRRAGSIPPQRHGLVRRPAGRRGGR